MMAGKAALERMVFSGIALLAVAGLAAAQPTINLIANAAADSAATGNVARGELISIYGTNLATSLGANFTPTSPVLSLGGASVTIGGMAAPLTYASPTQLDVQVPFELAAGVPSVNITVTVGGATSAPYIQNVVPADLGMAYAQVASQIFNVSAANTAIITATAGTTVAIVAFGLGAVTPAVPSGIITPAGTFSVLGTPPVSMNGKRVPVTSAVLASGAVGVYVVTVTVPSGATGPVTVVLGGQEAGATIESIAIDSMGDVYVANNNADSVSVFDRDGVFKFQFGSTGSGPGQLNHPTGIAIHSNGDVYVCDTGNNRIEVFDRDGRFRFQFRH